MINRHNGSSSKLPFTKMQALGNDFILIEESHLKTSLTVPQIRYIADRRKGIGCDQLILIKDSSQGDADVSFYNADGSKALACGNGTRCIAKYLNKETGLIQTPSFLSQFWKRGNKIAISLKSPTFLSSPGCHLELVSGSTKMLKRVQHDNNEKEGQLKWNEQYRVDIGNPHLVVFTEDLNSISFETFALSLQPPEGINVELAQIISPSTVKAKVWERGVGITPACGSGACAVGILSLQLGLVEKSPVTIEMEGGLLEVEWIAGTPPLLIGPADYCFKGIIELS